MWKKVLFGAGCILVFMVSVIVHAPASLLRVAPLPADLTIGNVDGTVWQGEVAQVRWQNYTLGPLEWDVQWHRLLTGATFEAAIDVRSPDGLRGKGILGFNGSELTLSQTLISAPARILTGSVAMPPNVAIEGTLDLILRDAVFAESGCQQLEGQLQWQQAALSLPVGRLNDIPAQAALACEHQGIVAQGQGQSASLSHKFSLSITPSGRYSVSGWLKPGVAYPTPMKAPLAWLGSPDNQGRYRFSFRG
ncbi:type II secretion system protein N [Salinivibrio sp. ES.052]|uniref:type II secretion system protein N n=1 Tax=Salinivibrio sp. ES.052 TaxID=1882823 RepID=UPI0009259539|nr:type II secretion system protein N [Salinivibrio sp. ES.052]SIO24453.1 type II secretion system protein N (GspN) [Salinivibrio sp. ES.052]